MSLAHARFRSKQLRQPFSILQCAHKIHHALSLARLGIDLHDAWSHEPHLATTPYEHALVQRTCAISASAPAGVAAVPPAPPAASSPEWARTRGAEWFRVSRFPEADTRSMASMASCSGLRRSVANASSASVSDSERLSWRTSRQYIGVKHAAWARAPHGQASGSRHTKAWLHAPTHDAPVCCPQVMMTSAPLHHCARHRHRHRGLDPARCRRRGRAIAAVRRCQRPRHCLGAQPRAVAWLARS